MGDLKLNGATSGTITLTPTAVAGTTTITLPATTGTVALTANPTFTGTVTATTVTSPSATALTIQSAGTTAMTVDTSQNVGIGTTSPGQKLSVLSTGMISYFNSTTTDGYIRVDETGGSINIFGGLSGVGFVGTSSNYPFTIRTNNIERMRIDSSGNLLVACTSTSTVNAGIAIIPNANTNTVGYVRIGHASGAGSGTGYLDFLYNNGIIGSVQQNGTNAVSFNTSSDYRLKANVAPMTTGLATVAALKPVTYEWISDQSQGEGFIAHELAEVIPLAVTGAKDAVDADGNPVHQGVDYSKIVVHLVAAIQELSAKNDALEASNAAFERRLAALENK